jgi:acyl-CoA dehydrogenase
MAANFSQESDQTGELAADTAARWLERNFDLKALLKLAEDPNGPGHPLEVWNAARELGWLAGLVPEQHGGLGLPYAESMALFQTLGRGLAPGPWMTSVLAAEAIKVAGSEEQQAKLLPGLASGDAMATVAGSNLQPPAVEFRGDRLSGFCGAVPYARISQHLIVPVADTAQRGPSLRLVDLKAPGVEIAPMGSVDGTWRLDTVRFNNVPSEPLDQPNAWDRFVARGALLTAADEIGIASRAIEITVDYVKTRKQFDKPIGANQGVKHPIVDAYVATTMARKGLLYAAQLLDQGDPDAAISVSVAKAKANDAAREATAAMIQFHGAMGFTWLHPAHLFFKRAKRQEYEFGDTPHHRERVAQHWLKETS